MRENLGDKNEEVIRKVKGVADVHYWGIDDFEGDKEVFNVLVEADTAAEAQRIGEDVVAAIKAMKIRCEIKGWEPADKPELWE